MKRAVSAGFLLVALVTSGSVRAADMAVAPRAPVAEPIVSWTGFYVGAHGGYGWGKDPLKQTGTPPFLVINDINSSGYVVGGHAGYNWQYGVMVAGLEIDLSTTGIKGSSSGSVVSGGVLERASIAEKFDLLGTARARIGFLPLQNVLLYGTGGLAWTQVTSDVSDQFNLGPSGALLSASTQSVSKSLFGFAVGAGAEASVGNFGFGAVVLRVEYLHYDFGSAALIGSSLNIVPTSSTNTEGRVTADVVRSGLTLKF